MNELDKKLMLFLNFDGGSVMDSIMWALTSRWAFIVVAIVMLFMFYQQMSVKRFIICFFYAALVILLCDQIANFFKASIPFLRPSHSPELEGLLHTVRGYKSGLYGTVSGHAANSIGLAVYGSLIIRKCWMTVFLFTFAALTMYSRIYLSVHFPSQLFFGMLLGAASGWVCYYLFTRACRRVR